jgi:hypothetical protein
LIFWVAVCVGANVWVVSVREPAAGRQECGFGLSE